MRGARWMSVLVVLVAVAVSACSPGDDNPRNCAEVAGEWQVEDLRREHGGWRFTTADSIAGATGDVWLSGDVGVIDYGAEHCPEEDDAGG